jgi:hypothetical protein
VKKIKWFGHEVKVLDTKRTYKGEVAAVLDRAADLFDELGWVKGSECDSSGKLCAVGAIALASGIPFYYEQDDDARYGSYAEFRYADATPEQRALAQKAAAAADLTTKGRSIIGLNDADKTKKHDVQDRLRRAAALVRDGEIETGTAVRKIGWINAQAPVRFARKGKKEVAYAANDLDMWEHV